MQELVSTTKQYSTNYINKKMHHAFFFPFIIPQLNPKKVSSALKLR